MSFYRILAAVNIVMALISLSLNSGLAPIIVNMGLAIIFAIYSLEKEE